MFDQPHACKAVGRRLAMFETGLGDTNKPLGSMFFLGPSGVGKTEMAHATAKYMFKDAHSDRLKIINMAEMQEDHYVTRFIGSPPSYVGYGEKPLIPHDWLAKGRSVIVLDEFEKAAPAIKQLFLGVLDKGKMDARAGTEGNRTLDFRDSVLIFTSNIAGSEIHKIATGQRLGFGDREQHPDTKNKDIENAAMAGVKKALSPELVNRIDDIVVFKEIEDRAVYDRMLSKFIDERNAQLVTSQKELAPYFAVTTEFRDFILEGAGKKGGRELKRILDRELFDKGADVVMGMDVRGKPLVANRELGRDADGTENPFLPEETYFYTDDNPPLHEVPAPVVKHIESGKKKDPGAFIGNKPYSDNDNRWNDEREPEIPSEKDTGEEDIKKPPKKEKAPKGPNEPVDIYDINVTYEDGTKDKITGLDKTISDIVLLGFGENPKNNGKRVISANSTLRKPEKKSLSFVIPAEGVIFDSMDMAITIRAGGHEYLQIVEGLPIVRGK